MHGLFIGDILIKYSNQKSFPKNSEETNCDCPINNASIYEKWIVVTPIKKILKICYIFPVIVL